MKTSLFVFSAAVLAASFASAEPRPDLVAKVVSGELKEARASWWGFDAVDSTRYLQAAFDSGARRLVIDKMPSPWIATPLRGASNQEVVFEPGAEILAKAGEFKNKNAELLRYNRSRNVKITGYGGTLRMRHKDYMQPPYEKSEWRHALSFLSCSNVVVEGLTLASSGGDGIYLGCNDSKFQKNVDVVIRDVLCDDNHRQGISVISAENLLIENTVLRETFGTAPAAGIDFEPNHPGEVLKNCVMRNCLAIHNQGDGYTTWAGQLNEHSAPVDIKFENCTAIGDRTSFSFACDSRRGRDVSGHIQLINCTFEKPRSARAVSLRGNRFGTLVYDISNCKIVQTNAVGGEVVSKMDEDWKKANIPHQFDPDFSIPHVSNPDLLHAEIFDSAPGQSIKLQPAKIRHSGTYLVYADAARVLHFSGHQVRVGRYEPATKPLVVTTLDGKPVAKIPLPSLKDTAFSFSAPQPGFYRLAVELGAVAFQMTASDAPIALDITEGAQGLISSVAQLWTVVPPKTPTFACFLCGEGTEQVHASLYSPQGVQVWDQDNISNWAKAVVRNGVPPGMWRLSLARPSKGAFEDTRVDLAGVPGFLFLSKEKTWSFR